MGTFAIGLLWLQTRYEVHFRFILGMEANKYKIILAIFRAFAGLLTDMITICSSRISYLETEQATLLLM